MQVAFANTTIHCRDGIPSKRTSPTTVDTVKKMKSPEEMRIGLVKAVPLPRTLEKNKRPPTVLRDAPKPSRTVIFISLVSFLVAVPAESMNAASSYVNPVPPFVLSFDAPIR